LRQKSLVVLLLLLFGKAFVTEHVYVNYYYYYCCHNYCFIMPIGLLKESNYLQTKSKQSGTIFSH